MRQASARKTTYSYGTSLGELEGAAGCGRKTQLPSHHNDGTGDNFITPEQTLVGLSFKKD
jgi:hypothetical protein